MEFTREELKKVSSNLPPSGREQLAEKFKIKLGSLRNILAGRSTNNEVVLAAIELAEGHKKALKEAKEKLSAL